jgi:propionate CoA-transferase
MTKCVTAEEAVSVIANSATVVVGGFGSYGSSEELLQALADRYEAVGSPRDLTIIAGIVPGDKTERTEPLTGYNIGLNRLRAEGLVGTVKVGLLNDARAFSWAVGDNKIAGYLLPMGVLISLFHTIAGGGPGFLTKVGLGTFCDPRQEGCMVNDKSREKGKVVELMEIDGEEYLFYKSFKPDVCLIRASYADEDGNISMDHEAVLGAELDMALGVHNNGGTVIVQVEDIVSRGTIHPKNVRIHGKLIDYVVKTTNPDYHRQCIAFSGYRSELSGDIRTRSVATTYLPMGVRKLITRRAAMELKPGIIINLGVGMPSGIGSISAEEGLGVGMTMSIEAGAMGGVVQEGLGFPASANPDAIFTTTDMINMYHGGILDMAILGAAEIDAKGNVNVSKFGGRSNGPGGFIDISQNAKTVVFMGNFTAGKSDIEVTENGLVIRSDGESVKFVNKLQQITFSGVHAIKNGKIVKFITERAVFELSAEGLVLTEIAPGIDLQKDILNKMEFSPIIAKSLKPMDSLLFREGTMGLTNE